MRRVLRSAALALAMIAVLAAPAQAGSPHFVGDITATRSGDSLTVEGKIAGLGDEAQVHVVLTADVQCVNPGNNQPQAENKGATLAEGTFPVQNGKATFILTGSVQTDPRCNPPMTLVYANVTITDATSGISTTLPGTF